MTLEGKITLFGLFAFAIWLFVGLPFIYLYLPSDFPMLSVAGVCNGHKAKSPPWRALPLLRPLELGRAA